MGYKNYIIFCRVQQVFVCKPIRPQTSYPQRRHANRNDAPDPSQHPATSCNLNAGSRQNAPSSTIYPSTSWIIHKYKKKSGHQAAFCAPTTQATGRVGACPRPSNTRHVGYKRITHKAGASPHPTSPRGGHIATQGNTKQANVILSKAKGLPPPHATTKSFFAPLRMTARRG